MAFELIFTTTTKNILYWLRSFLCNECDNIYTILAKTFRESQNSATEYLFCTVWLFVVVEQTMEILERFRCRPIRRALCWIWELLKWHLQQIYTELTAVYTTCWTTTSFRLGNQWVYDCLIYFYKKIEAGKCLEVVKIRQGPDHIMLV